MKYRVLLSMTNLVGSTKMQSLTDLMFKTINKTDGEMIGTEVYLERDGLCRKITIGDFWCLCRIFIILQSQLQIPNFRAI